MLGGTVSPRKSPMRMRGTYPLPLRASASRAYHAPMPDPVPSLVVVGTVLQTPTPTALQVLRDVAVVVGSDGVITDVQPVGSIEAAAATAAARRVERLATGERLLPGLIDTHLHAPQWPQLGTGLDLPLEQ